MKVFISFCLIALSSSVLATPLGSLTSGQFLAANVDLADEPWIPADSQTPDPTFAALYAWNIGEVAFCDYGRHNAWFYGPFGNEIHTVRDQRAAPTKHPSVALGILSFTGQWYNRIPNGATSGNQYYAKFSGGLLMDTPLIGGTIACVFTPFFVPLQGIETGIGYLGD